MFWLWWLVGLVIVYSTYVNKEKDLTVNGLFLMVMGACLGPLAVFFYDTSAFLGITLIKRKKTSKTEE